MKRKNIWAVLAVAAICVSFSGFTQTEVKASETTTEKKALPKKEAAPAAEESADGHYKSTMKPFEELIPSDRIVILQNALNYGREGFYTEETKPVTESISYQEEEVQAYSISYALDFLNAEVEGMVKVVTEAEEVEVEAEDFAAMYVIIDDFQSGNKPVLYNPETETEVVDFLYAITENGEGVYSIVTEKDDNVMALLEKMGWETTETYRLVATDKFYIPITPEDYDDGELRGSLSGSINASFPEMTIAGGKMNDIFYFERVVE